MTRRTRTATIGLACVLLLAGCGGEAPDGEVVAEPERASPPATTTATATEPAAPPESDAPPPVTVRYFDDSVALEAWTFCYRNLCADGSPPAHPSDVGSPEEVIVEFPLPGWSFTASFQPAGKQCGRIQEAPLEPVGDGRFRLRPAGYAGAYDVTLFGRGDGDLFTTFRWTTPVEGPLPTPQARLAVLANHDGRPDSYGVELELTNLARTPRQASARITVRAADGDAVAFDATRSDLHCLPEGTVYWDGPDDRGLEAAALGKGPFRYEVELVLDGSRYFAEAAWPADEIVGNEPSVALEFTPGLPRLG
jgi:hypothetical protein